MVHVESERLQIQPGEEPIQPSPISPSPLESLSIPVVERENFSNNFHVLNLQIEVLESQIRNTSQLFDLKLAFTGKYDVPHSSVTIRGFHSDIAVADALELLLVDYFFTAKNQTDTLSAKSLYDFLTLMEERHHPIYSKNLGPRITDIVNNYCLLTEQDNPITGTLHIPRQTEMTWYSIDASEKIQATSTVPSSLSDLSIVTIRIPLTREPATPENIEETLKKYSPGYFENNGAFSSILTPRGGFLFDTRELGPHESDPCKVTSKKLYFYLNAHQLVLVSDDVIPSSDLEDALTILKLNGDKITTGGLVLALLEQSTMRNQAMVRSASEIVQGLQKTLCKEFKLPITVYSKDVPELTTTLQYIEKRVKKDLEFMDLFKQALKLPEFSKLFGDSTRQEVNLHVQQLKTLIQDFKTETDQVLHGTEQLKDSHDLTIQARSSEIQKRIAIIAGVGGVLTIALQVIESLPVSPLPVLLIGVSISSALLYQAIRKRWM